MCFTAYLCFHSTVEISLALALHEFNTVFVRFFAERQNLQHQAQTLKIKGNIFTNFTLSFNMN